MVLPFSSMNVDINGRCNLRCRFCPEGMKLNEQPALRMSFALFQQWIGPLLPDLRKLELLNWSEPLLNEELFEILHWTAKQNPDLMLRLATNGTLIDREVSERLICSPLKALTITIAGLNREDYRLLPWCGRPGKGNQLTSHPRYHQGTVGLSNSPHPNTIP